MSPMIEQAKKLLAARADDLNGVDFSQAIQMINLIKPDDTVFSWMAKCAEAELDCMVWEDLFEPLMPDSSELTEEESRHLRMMQKEIEGYYSYVSI